MSLPPSHGRRKAPLQAARGEQRPYHPQPCGQSGASLSSLSSTAKCFRARSLATLRPGRRERERERRWWGGTDSFVVKFSRRLTRLSSATGFEERPRGWYRARVVPQTSAKYPDLTTPVSALYIGARGVPRRGGLISIGFKHARHGMSLVANSPQS